MKRTILPAILLSVWSLIGKSGIFYYHLCPFAINGSHLDIHIVIVATKGDIKHVMLTHVDARHIVQDLFLSSVQQTVY